MERRGGIEQTSEAIKPRAKPSVGRTAALARFERCALSERDLQVVMDGATRLVTDVFGVELGAILERAPSGDRFVRRSYVGYRGSPELVLRALTAGLADYTMRVTAPVVVDDFTSETRFHCPPLLHEGILSALSVTIRLPGESPFEYGALVVGSRTRRTFDVEDVTFLEAVSSVIGATIHRRVRNDQLRRSEERFALLAEAMDGGALVPITPEGSIAGWSAPAERLWGWRAEAVIGRHVSALAVAEDALRGRVDELLRLAARDGHVEVHEWGARSDGSRFRAAANLFALRSEQGTLRGFALAARDISARFEAEAERTRLLAEIERRHDLLKAVIEQFPAGVIVCEDPSDVHVSMVSKQFETLWGLPLEHGSRYAGHCEDHLAFYPDGRRLGDADFGGARALRGETVRQELIFRRSDGTTFEVLDNAAPLHDRHGRIVGSIAWFYDTSAEKAALREREQLLEETRRAVRARDEVLAVVSHDLRNHLGVILLAAAQLGSGTGDVDPACIRGLAGQIRRASSGMGQIMSDLLDVGRIDAGRLVIEPTEQDAGEVVCEAIDLFAALAAERDVELRTTLDGLRGTRLSCDRARVIQVLSNLVGNALKLVPPRGAIEVGGRRGERDVQVFVRDDGPGISPGDLPHLFDRYWQASRRDAKRGIGLGLSIVKGIVEAHGGRVWVESTPGKGATFTFSLPIAAPGAQPVAPS